MRQSEDSFTRSWPLAQAKSWRALGGGEGDEGEGTGTGTIERVWLASEQG